MKVLLKKFISKILNKNIKTPLNFKGVFLAVNCNKILTL